MMENLRKEWFLGIRAKLSSKEVEEIRALYKTDRYTHRGLGKKFDVSSTTVFHIIHNNLWKK